MFFARPSRPTPFVFLTMAATLTALTASSAGFAQDKPDEKAVVSGPSATAPHPAASPDSITEGSVTVGGQAIAYKAIAGTITVGGTDPQDATLGFDGKPLPDSNIKLPERIEDAPPTARMFYVP